MILGHHYHISFVFSVDKSFHGVRELLSPSLRVTYASEDDYDRAKSTRKDTMLGNMLNDFRRDPEIYINEQSMGKIIDTAKDCFYHARDENLDPSQVFYDLLYESCLYFSGFSVHTCSLYCANNHRS